MIDQYRVLPHRDIIEIGELACDNYPYEHRQCGMRLTEREVKEDNWCCHCVGYINKAAKRRGELSRR